MGRTALDATGHILSAIEQIERFTRSMSLESFTADMLTVRAVERCLEVISEASRSLPEEVKASHPGIRWRAMADAGNLYRHGYEQVSAPVLWQTVVQEIPPLRAVMLVIRDRLSSPAT